MYPHLDSRRIVPKVNFVNNEDECNCCDFIQLKVPSTIVYLQETENSFLVDVTTTESKVTVVNYGVLE